jgi:peroxiredoxin
MDEQQHPPAMGERVPDIALPDTGGKSRRLGELAAGGLCVVVFYRGHW